MRPFAVGTALVLLLAVTLPALAQESDGEAEVIELYKQAEKLKAAGKSKASARVYEKAVARAEVAIGKDHVNTATLMNNLAILYSDMAEYAKAEPLYKRSLEIREAKLGKDHPDVAASLNNLAILYKGMGRYAKAEPLYKRGLEIHEARLGKDHPSVAASLNNLAILYSYMGRYAKAEPLYKRGLEIREARLGKDHPEVAASLNNLANLYMDMGQDAKAEPLYKRGLEIREAKLGKDHLSVAQSLNNLAGLYRDMGRYAKAEPLYKRGLQIKEARLGKDHPDVAGSVNNLANLYRVMAQYAKAEPLYKRSLEIREARLGKDHPDVAGSLNNLAGLYRNMGRDAKAEPLFKRGLEIWEARLGKDHPDVATSLNNLALLQGSQGRSAEAASLFDRARQSARRHVTSVLPVLSEAEQLSFLQRMEQSRLKLALSLALRYNNDERDALSASWLVNGKAQATESLARSALLAQNSSDPQTGKLVAQLLTVRRTLASLALRTPLPGTEKEHIQRHQRLVAREQELARKLRLAGSTAVAEEWVELAQVRRGIPTKGVFLDVVRMRVHDYQAKPNSKGWQPARYVAWVTPKEGQVQVVDLGEARHIDEAVEKLRQALKGAPKLIKGKGEPLAEKALRDPLQKLSDLVLKPLQPHVGKAESWVVSPDGNLWLVPWQMLLLSDGKYALEKHRISYLNSGRELITRTSAKAERARALVMADPDFDLSGEDLKAHAGQLVGKADPDETRSLSSLMKLGSIRRLPGTGAEAKAIRPALNTYLKEMPRLRTGGKASKAAFLATKNPRVLVLSTHGFFLADQKPQKQDPRLEGAEGKQPAAGLENPLLRCGLLLAGCNTAGAEGVLTGLEVVGADLRGCELVVLSACETGLGDVQSGEGVAGLRQAFQLAGAEAVVSTLWQVPDRQSAQLMSLFFANLSKGQSKAEALRQAQIKVIEERRDDNAAAHPFFWAAFTLTGR